MVAAEIFGAKAGLLSPLSRHHTTEGGWKCGPLTICSQARVQARNPRHVAASSCLLSISSPDFFLNPKEKKQQQKTFLKILIRTHIKFACTEAHVSPLGRLLE